MTAYEAIRDALLRLPQNAPKPTRVFLGEIAYDALHKEAKDAGIRAAQFPLYEDDRLEFRGMKVYCHRSKEITFE